MSRVKELREAQNLKIREMAALIGASLSTYSKKENGALRFSLSEAKILADFFDKSIEWLFFGDEFSEMENNHHQWP